MYKVSFVILHYEVINDTIECIESIISNLKYKHINIIVVDNCSPNGSGKQLINKYQGISNINIIINGKNLGFANGNNVGFRYAKYELKSDFIILINNDTVINQKNFIDLLIEKYKSTNYSVLGPDVVSLKDGGHQNPQRLSGLVTRFSVLKVLIRYMMLLLLNYLDIEMIMRNLYKSIKGNKEVNINKEGFSELHINVQLNGCCLIFSPVYINKYDGLYNKTFMYMEEDILYYISQRDKLINIYYPEIKIYHKEDSATTKICKNDNMKRRFFYKNCLKSGIELYKIIEK